MSLVCISERLRHLTPYNRTTLLRGIKDNDFKYPVIFEVAMSIINMEFIDNKMKMLSSHDRFRILDSSISIADVESATDAVCRRVKSGDGGYICFSNVHTVVMSKKDLSFREITNNSFLSMPDGKPLSIYARKKGYVDVQQVAGPDFMPHLLEKGEGLKHYFYGSTPETLKKLVENFTELYPKVMISGAYSPPFRELSSIEIEKIITDIKNSGADIIWIGLGAPKQEYWMLEHWEQLKPAVLMGVGAAFDFHAGLKPRAPAWMKKYSLEWFHRLCSEPGRLWKRYLVTNTKFLFYILYEIIFSKKT